MTVLTAGERPDMGFVAPHLPNEIKRPAVSAEMVESFDVGRRLGSSSTDEMDPEEGFALWVSRAEASYQSSLRLAQAHPDSSAAAARLVQAATVLGDQELIRESAKSCLSRISKHSFDAPAAYVSLAALLGIEDVETVASAARELPNNPSINLLLASALTDLGNLDEARELVKGCETSAATTLYAFLIGQDDPGQAVHLLRKVLREDPFNVNAILLYSQLRAEQGLWNQAVRYGLRASTVAPGRRDVSLSLLRIMLGARQVDDAKKQISALKARGVVETPDFLMIQAQVQLSLGENRKAIELLGRAHRKLAPTDVLAGELECNIAALRKASGMLSRVELLKVLRSQFRSHPDSVVIATHLFNVLTRTSDGPELREVIESLQSSSVAGRDLIGLETRLAYTECDWAKCLRLSLQWHEVEPSAQLPARFAAMIGGQLENRWADAAAIMKGTMKLSADEWLANDAAYIFALAGEIEAAESAARMIDATDYAGRATLGLVVLASGDPSAGLRLYREAAEIADRMESDFDGRALMTVHQAMAIKRMLPSGLLGMDVRAGSLPPVELPSNWDELPSFRLLHDAALGQGWEWPVRID